MVTVPSDGAGFGAVKTVAWPLIVWVRLSAPQFPPPQVKVQFAPALLGSFVTLAMIMACAPTARIEGGPSLKFTVTVLTTATVTVAVAVRSVTDAAVMFMLFPVGGRPGAVNTVVTPLAVCVGEKLPQLALAQLTFQLTPALAGSFVTVADRVTVVPVSIEEGGAKV
jgi:hypothetical protein